MGVYPHAASAEPPPETGMIRVSTSTAIGTTPELISEDLLRTEGLKAADICALEPERVAGHLAEKKFTLRQDYALATLRP